MRRRIAAVLTLSALPLAMLPAAAAASDCLQVAQAPSIHWPGLPGYDAPTVRRASLTLEAEEVGLTFVGHASFRIETPQGVTAVTDYAGFWGPGDPPEIATMNKAHSSHWTPNPDPRIEHILRGWNPEGGEAMHYEQVGDLLVRNVPTDIRTWGGEVEAFGNSIFVFEAHGLCIGHLGHLHHKPTDIHYGMIGRLDVVMAPVDGGYTMNQAAMIEVLQRLRARIVIPMHWFGVSNLERFLEGMRGQFAVVDNGGPSLVVSKRTLPAEPTVMVLR
jgi:L-ascorbate metabolism protein UlaG (beta-lactamase superfamily)